MKRFFKHFYSLLIFVCYFSLKVELIWSIMLVNEQDSLGVSYGSDLPQIVVTD